MNTETTSQRRSELNFNRRRAREGAGVTTWSLKMNDSNDTQQAHLEDGPRGNRATQSGVSPPVDSTIDDPRMRLLTQILKRARTSDHWVVPPGNAPSHRRSQLTDDVLGAHLTGAYKVGACPMERGASTTRLALFDLDSHKGEVSWDEMRSTARRVIDAAAACGLRAIAVRSSGGHGIHLIFMWNEQQDARSVRALLADVLTECGLKNGTKGVREGQVEIFPKQDSVPADGWGNMFVLPFAGKSVALDPYTLQEIGAGAVKLRGSDDVPVVEPEPPREVAAPCDAPELDEIREALAAIDPNDFDYDGWLRILFSVHAGTDGGEEGLALILDWSARFERYDAQASRAETEKQWSFARSKKEGGITVATLYAAAAARGYVPPSRRPSAEGLTNLVEEAKAKLIAEARGYAQLEIPDALPEAAHLVREAAALPEADRPEVFDQMREAVGDEAMGKFAAAVRAAEEVIARQREASRAPAALRLADLPDVVSVPAKVESAVHLPAPFGGPMAGAVSAALAVAPKPQPALTTLAALIGMAACIPGHYRLPSGARMNLYGLAAAETGAGKDLPRNVARAIAHAGGAVEIGRPASGQGLEDSLIAGRPMLCEIDEIGHVLKAVNDSKAPPHLVELTRTYLALYSASSNRYNCRVRANGKPGATSMPRVIENPCVSLLGFSTPEKLGEALGVGSIEDGLLGRMLFVMGEADVEQRRISEPFELPGVFKEYQAALGQGLAIGSDGCGEEIVVGYGLEVSERLDVLVREFSLEVARSPFSKALRARSFEKVERVAGVLAVFDAPRAPVMTLEHVEWATEFVRSSNAALERFAADFMHGGQVQADAHRVLGVVGRMVSGEIAVQRTGQLALVRKGLAPRTSVLKASKLDKRRFDEAVAHLVATGDVEATEVQEESGRKAHVLRREGER